ncbi:Zinc finger, RING/FYVE/PHD-type [Artemisia annua]|uniref:Zinc finger, RING/FYVE/PHD-type n=1 Tax=Artemisia annua TaxID=35608 RepID=A0A2U1MJB7_ARTAN|nr:Zinc finger, RING/FYVE/PHD-type [Artemisia annua]
MASLRDFIIFSCPSIFYNDLYISPAFIGVFLWCLDVCNGYCMSLSEEFTVFCILRWATYKKEPTCPQCKHPFEFLNVHRSLDGRYRATVDCPCLFSMLVLIVVKSVTLNTNRGWLRHLLKAKSAFYSWESCIHDYMFEESVCLLLRASWFHPLHVENHEVVDDHAQEETYAYGWGNNGFVRAGKQEARPVYQQPQFQDSGAGSSSREPKKKESSAAKDTAAVGRRAKRALKREAADKAAAAKHQQHLVRLGRN